MSRILIIFGAEGALGKGATEVLLDKNYDHFYLVNRKFQYFSESKKITLIESGDLSDEDEVIRVFDNITVKSEDQLYLFSTVGGFAGGDSVAETDYALWNKMINLNLNISFLTAKHFSILVKNATGGSLLFTGALASMEPEENNSAYSVSKNALNFLVKTLALEGKKYNLSTNAILPYVIDTPENREWVEDSTIMVAPAKIGETVHTIFEKYEIFSGNLLALPGTIGGVK